MRRAILATHLVLERADDGRGRTLGGSVPVLAHRVLSGRFPTRVVLVVISFCFVEVPSVIFLAQILVWPTVHRGTELVLLTPLIVGLASSSTGLLGDVLPLVVRPLPLLLLFGAVGHALNLHLARLGALVAGHFVLLLLRLSASVSLAPASLDILEGAQLVIPYLSEARNSHLSGLLHVLILSVSEQIN